MAAEVGLGYETLKASTPTGPRLLCTEAFMCDSASLKIVNDF
jgi:hypothetical protein